jgi:hypothetical protein
VRRLVPALVASIIAMAAAGAEAHMDHPAPGFAPAEPLSTAINAGVAEEGEWELIATIPTGNPHTDLDFFKHDGEDYVSAGTLAFGPNSAGQTIVQLTQDGEVNPQWVSGHPSATCPGAATGVTGLQHDAEATPKGGTLLGAPNPHQAAGEAQLLVDATDAEGRCHDQGELGLPGAPLGGLELIDITDPAAPVEIGLTSHIGEAHTVNIDPKRPHIAFVSSSDGVTIDDEGKRENETSGSAFDGIEVVDMSTCMNFPDGATTQEKRDTCRPEVYRYRWPQATMATASAFPNELSGCHEVEIYPDDRLTCASIMATLMLDLSGAFDDRGTPNDFTDDKPRGTPLPCKLRDSTTVTPGFSTGAKITDCTESTADQPLRVKEWLESGAPSLEGVEHLGTVHHMGFEDQAGQSVDPPFDSTEDVFVSHEAELTTSKRFVLVTDERGGGVLPGGATCSNANDIRIGNGGIHAYPVGNFSTTVPGSPEEAQQAYAQNSEGQRAIYRAQIRTQPQGSVCTSHVFQQIPGQNRIFMAWYSQGTQVVDFTENGDRIDMKYAGHFIPEGANTWTSAIWKVERNADGTFTYWGATGDFALAGVGRNAIDIYKVTLPAPPEPAGGRRAGTPDFPPGRVCAARTAFNSVDARPRGRGLRFAFDARGNRPVAVQVLRQTTGRRIGKLRRVRTFKPRKGSFNWSGRGKRVRNGYYIVRFFGRKANGDREVRRVALGRVKGRFRKLRKVEQVNACALLRSLKLSRTVFNRQTPLGISFKVEETSRVRVTVKRGGKRVERFNDMYQAGRTHRLRFSGRGQRPGLYHVKVLAQRQGRVNQVTLGARRLR